MAPEVERALLGSVLADNAVLPKVAAIVTPEDFGVVINGMVWRAMLELARIGQAVDHLTLAEKLKNMGELAQVGGPAFLMGLDQVVPVAANAMEYAAIVRDRSARRRVAQIARDLAIGAEDLTADLEKTASEASASLARSQAGKYRIRTLHEINLEVSQRLTRIQDGEEEPVIRTGLDGWDKAVGGLQLTLTTIGGEGGGGKSALAAAMVESIARNGEPVCLFSLEDSGDWMTYRLLAARSGVANFIIRFQRKSDEQWERIAEAFPKLSDQDLDQRIFVLDETGLSSHQIVSRMIDLRVNRGVRVFFVDHLQEIEHDVHKQERHELNVRRTVQALRNFANDYQAAVVLLCQGKEGVERKPDQPPSRSDFMDAPNAISKPSRVQAYLTLDPDEWVLTGWFLKHTNGQQLLKARFKFIRGAGLVADMPRSAEQLDAFHRAGEDTFEPTKTPPPAPAPQVRRLELVKPPATEAPAPPPPPRPPAPPPPAPPPEPPGWTEDPDEEPPE